MKQMETIFKSNSAAYAFPGILPLVHVSYNKIKQLVCDQYGISIDLLNSKTRKREVCEPRQICMFLGRRHLKMTLQECATPFAKDHATVLHSIRIVSNLYETNNEFRKTLQLVMQRIGIDHESFIF